MKLKIADPATSPASLWQLALDQSASGILVYEAVRTPDGDIETFVVRLANRRAEQILGLPRTDMLGHTAADLFPAQHPTNLWSNIAEVIESGEPLHTELFYHVSRTDRDQWFDLGIEPLGDGQSAVVSFTDITELKNATQALLGEAILFKTLSSSVPGMCVVVINYFQKVLFANGDLPGLYVHRDAREVVGKRIDETILPEFRSDWQRYISTALMGQQHSFSNHWGGWWCECYVGPVRNDHGDIVMAICVYRDISEQYRQQQTLQRMNSDLQRSNQSLEQFAYMASHDLQEPLRKIKSFSDLLQDRYADQLDEAGKDMIRRMQSGADRMNDLIKNLLDYARMTTPASLAEGQKQDLVSIDQLMNDIVADLDMVINERGALIKTGPNLPMVPGDATQLRQLFQNLLTNAMKFTRPGQRPEITITGRLIRGTDVPPFANVNQAQTYALISIQDNGIGIAPENFDKIFGLFTRLHGRQQFSGSGIGLATCKRVVENHGGTITVDSKLDHGTTFHAYLPLHIPEQMIY